MAFLLFICLSCSDSENQIQIDDISPWCIVSFDALERKPMDRITMLKNMGFTKYGYNWREKHLPEMKEEFRLAKANNMQIVSIFLWLNAERDSIGKLSPLNEKLFENLKDIENKPKLWLSFSPNFFENLTQEESVELTIRYIKFIKTKADNVGCKLALYNHRGWFGNPENQIEIIKKMPEDSLRMVYNFHHAHEYLEVYPKLFKTMIPYLDYVNLNGMQKEGPEILTIGKGNYEYDMVKTLYDEGYDGPWGVLGHIQTEDVQKVLERNMEGIKLLNAKLLHDDN
ncbi:hypothetical protein [Psychroserpens algicola]|uniref:Sugar phosphate isomerase/epimerase n=1 Tax=Psychroserpens algicola TaxID=1719034 RepID=A0ABT0HBD7_9FLAO|nr:hypothetical protein [Psychroserpens algicola]MCK8481668.1 hypothetical protein [Psychroserpens algicola]